MPFLGACDWAGRQGLSIKTTLPLALNQLCTVETLTDQVDQVLQLNGVYN